LNKLQSRNWEKEIITRLNCRFLQSVIFVVNRSIDMCFYWLTLLAHIFCQLLIKKYWLKYLY